MPSHPVQIGSHLFASKSVAKSYVSMEILHAYAPGTPITDPDHIDTLFDILRRKRNAAEKIGTGIDHFYVTHTSNFRSYVRPDALTIAIHRTTGRDVDLGYGKAIDNSSEVDHAKDALRHAVQDLRDGFKFSHFGSGSPAYDEEGIELNSHDDSEVRYRNPSWGKLTGDFADSEGGWVNVETHSGGGTNPLVGRRLVSEGQLDRWREYYRANAVPVLSRKAGH